MLNFLSIEVETLEGQEEDNVTVAWSFVSFTENELVINLEFANPGQISQGKDKNTLSVTVLDGSLFMRKSDGFQIPIGHSALLEIPKMDGNPELSAAFEQAGAGVQLSGQSVLILSAAFSFFSSGFLNTVLSSVRSLSLVTHFMMM